MESNIFLKVQMIFRKTCKQKCVQFISYHKAFPFLPLRCFQWKFYALNVAFKVVLALKSDPNRPFSIFAASGK